MTRQMQRPIKKAADRKSVVFSHKRGFIFTGFVKMLGYMFLLLFLATTLLVSMRGNPGNPTQDQLNTPYWKDNGPFELSPERGRFALLYSLVENHSFQFS